MKPTKGQLLDLFLLSPSYVQLALLCRDVSRKDTDETNTGKLEPLICLKDTTSQQWLHSERQTSDQGLIDECLKPFNRF